MRQICVMNRFIMTCLALAYVVVSLAQGTVKGRVLDKQTNEVLQFVNIRVTQSATGKMVKGAITDAKGTFNVTGLADGKYVLTVSFMGYKGDCDAILKLLKTAVPCRTMPYIWPETKRC